MTNESPTPTQLTAIEVVANSATPDEQLLLLSWAKDLQKIRNSNVSQTEKFRLAIAVTRSRNAIKPILKLLFKELKRVGWDERTWAGRLGWGGLLLALATVGGGTGGFAAFGTAVAVPLWLVASGSGIVLGTLINTLENKLKAFRN